MSKNNELKSLRDMDLNEATLLYKNIFENILGKNLFEEITNNYQIKYNKFLEFKNKGYNSPTAMGRDKIAYGRNIIYGWFVEELIGEVIKKNTFVSNIIYFGQDKEHDFIYDDIKKNITINGKKTTDPDILIELKNKTKFLVEIKTGARNIFTIKKGNVDSLIKSTADYNLSCIVLMLDLAQGLFEIKDLNYFLNQKPFPNGNMEGQLCYEFPFPKNQINEIINLNFDTFLDISILENLQVRKFRMLKLAIEKDNKVIAKVIKSKIELEKIQEQKLLSDEEYNNKIQKIISKNSLVLKSWTELETLI
jgi:hypothetical protein